MTAFEFARYVALREEIVQSASLIETIERRYMTLVANALTPYCNTIVDDFATASDLLPFWRNYPPRQRGRAPTGESTPWSEVGETVIGPYAVTAIMRAVPKLRVPGLPSGADYRFLSDDALVHFDIKITGPNDEPNEVVASPNQLSGDGIKILNDGVFNSPVTITGTRVPQIFQPELPPFYVVDDKVRICITLFFKGVYEVRGVGDQPLKHMELACVPNGLLAFAGPNYNQSQTGLFIPGKDIATHPKKRVRIRLIPLKQLADWRRQTLWKIPE